MVLDGRLARLRLQAIDPKVANPAQFGDGSLRHVGRKRLPWPAMFVFDFAETFPLDRPGDHHGGLTGRLPCLLQRLVDLVQVVAVDHDGAAAEGLDSIAVDVGLPLIFGWAPLAEAVDVEDRGEVRKAVEPGLVASLPDGTFGQLAVPGQGPDVKAELVELATGKRDPDGDRQALPQTTGRDVDPGEARRRVPFQPRAN